MTDLTCPTCGTKLMQHPADNGVTATCLHAWLRQLLPELHFTGGWSWDGKEALVLMKKMWEIDEDAEIHRDWIVVHRFINLRKGYSEILIDGPTFPLRVCRAAIYLAVRKEQGK